MTPRTSEQFEQMRTESRKKIMDAALELFTRNGYDNTPISKISKKAGVSTGLMYNYFKSKDQLLEELLVVVVEISKKSLDVILELDDPFDQIERFVNRTIYRMSKPKVENMSKLIILVQVQPNATKKMIQILRDYHQHVYDNLERIFIEMDLAEPEKEARLLPAILSGFRIQYFLFRNKFPFDEMYELVMERYTDI